MKICIITIHFGVNHGSALQAYALSKYLTQLGYNVEVIDYIPKRYNAWHNIKKKKYPLIIKFVYYLITSPKRNYKRKVFENFLEANIKLTKRYYSAEDLTNNPPEADIYVAGSDQIWNKEYNGEDEYSYFLTFVPKGKKRIAYAASFGRSKIEKIEQEEISPYLKEFRNISVREDTGLNILKECKINDGAVALDPTLLLDKEIWRELSSNLNINDKYLLIYVMDHKYEKLLEYGEILAKKLNLKIYVICFSKIMDKRIDSCFYNINPKDFLYLIDNASFVVTNSYHGVMFSINFERQFIAVSKGKYNTRIESILNLLNLKNRFFYDEFDKDKVKEKINYKDVTDNLNRERNKSTEFLKNAIHDKDNHV